MNLRFNEDFSYLRGDPGTYEPDWFDPIKDIDLGNDWRLSLGGEFRFRYESENNKSFGAVEPASDSFALFRYMVHADFKYGDVLRVFAQGISAFDEERDLALRGIDENRWDLHQLFVDLKVLRDDCPLTLRVGRQELQYGNQRLLSPLEWANVRRRFDGVSLFAHGETWDVDMFYAKPVLVQRMQRDRFNEDFDLWGLYATYKGIENHGLDLYFLAMDDTGAPMNPNLKVGDRNIYTLGSRFWGKTGGFDYEAELAGQWGHWAGDTVQAWSWTLDGGYTFNHNCKPRIGAGVDWASGDEHPLDGKVGTFTQHFPLGHKYFGYMDLVGRQNMTAFNVNMSAWAVPNKVKANMAFHMFWLNDSTDALYNAGGAAVRRDIFGRSGSHVGNELDMTVAWKYDSHQSVLVGYSHFWDADFIQRTGASEEGELYYLQYQFKF